MTSTLVKPAAPQDKTSAQAQPQAPARAQIRPPAPAQPHRPGIIPPALGSSPSGARCLPSESLDEDRLSDFPESKASKLAKQAWSELLDRVANFCELERGDTEEQKQVMGMKRPLYHDPARSTINLALPWQSVAEEIADLKILYGNPALSPI